jgi:hypothetical protein
MPGRGMFQISFIGHVRPQRSPACILDLISSTKSCEYEYKFQQEQFADQVPRGRDNACTLPTFAWVRKLSRRSSQANDTFVTSGQIRQSMHSKWSCPQYRSSWYENIVLPAYPPVHRCVPQSSPAGPAEGLPGALPLCNHHKRRALY